MKKILFLVPYPLEGASYRFRVAQYLPFLKKEGYICRVRPFISSEFYKIIYKKGNIVRKFAYFIVSTLNRMVDIIRSLNYDVIFIHREAFPIGGPIIENIMKRFKKRIVFDFDDAIYLPVTSKYNNFIENFKKFNRLPKIMAMSDLVIVGNNNLKKYALSFNKNVEVIPTVVDSEVYALKSYNSEKSKIVIGWIGSITTVEYLEEIRGVFERLANIYSNIEIRIVGGEFPSNGLSLIHNRQWLIDREADEIREFDIGIMPMPDNEWTRGKCGFKAILYMSIGIPAVCSPVGVTKEIIRDGVNGFLAQDKNEWFEKLSILINNFELRKKIGMTGRKDVEEKYSLKIYAPKFLEVIQAIC